MVAMRDDTEDWTNVSGIYQLYEPLGTRRLYANPARGCLLKKYRGRAWERMWQNRAGIRSEIKAMERDPNFEDVSAHDRFTNTWFSVEYTLNSGALVQNAHHKQSAPTVSPETCAAGVRFSL
jgi:hypothetical protein